jgi:hypothetical protein
MHQRGERLDISLSIRRQESVEELIRERLAEFPVGG